MLSQGIAAKRESTVTDASTSSSPGHPQQIKYDVALFFASEQRNYVEKVKDDLLRAELNVFYDGDEREELRGTHLNETPEEIYLNQSRFCILFISAEFAKKPWT